VRIELVDKVIDKSPSILACSELIAYGRTSSWWLQRMHFHKSSNRLRGIPVLPNDGAGMYFDGAIVDHKLLLLNSNFEARMRIPKNLSNSPQDVFSELCAVRTLFVKQTISCKSVDGNIIRK
jgi:hypothetical protein